MGFTSLIGPAISAGSKAAGSAGNKGGGGGGVSPQEAALAQYTMGQNILKNDSMFASSGTGVSTMKTMENAGAELGGAKELASISDTNAAAQQQVNNSLTNLASSAGFGTQSGSMGTSGGSLDTSGASTT